MKAPLALRILVVVFAIIIIALLWVIIFYNPAQPQSGTSSSAASSTAIVSPDGSLTIATSSLQENATVSSPLSLVGTVQGGGWFFEATFPITIVDGSGTVIGTTTAHAVSEWASTGTVPWHAVLTFTPPDTATGTIIFASDNPSGDPSKQKTLSVPVQF